MRDVAHEYRNGEYEESFIGRLCLRDLRHVDYNAILATTLKGFKKLLNLTKNKSKKDVVITIDIKEIERMNSFEYLGARIKANRKRTPEIRRG